MKKISKQNRNHFKRRSVYEIKHKSRSGKKRTLSWSGSFEAQKVVCPKNFTLQYEHCEMVLKRISEIKQVAVKKLNINIDMKQIIEIGEGAISMLLSVLEESKANHGVKVFGSMPIDKHASQVLENSGFLKFVQLADQKHTDKKNTILKTGDESTPQTMLKKEIRKVNDTVWGLSGRNPLAYGCVFEMMRNTVDHAFKKADSVKWHWGISHSESEKLVKFSFVDNGRGLISTFKLGALKKFLHLFKDDVDLVETAFKSGIESRTGLSWRGKGLPTIFETFNDGYIRSLVVITNNIYIDFEKGIKRQLKNGFKGTYYYWVIDQKCEKACFL